ncbi:MAG TPA: NADH-quinone oxidoreductase subunit NuoG [Acidimicrobiales bacterium]
MTDTKAADDAGMEVEEIAPEEPPGVAITLNGREIRANPGELVIAAAERNGVYIPRFCYHSRMNSVGMCRMCIVDIDTGRGPALQPSCMIECTEGMKVDTESATTQKAQEGVLEFLLVNHPLDCPVCDKGGECPLQDQTMAYGPGESRFVEEKRHFEKPIPVSDVVLLDRERCILCDRCTRFAKEVAGDPLIHFIDRGNETQVNTFPGHPFASYFSGNTVQICPVGALTATPYRFKARPWDLEEVESTCTSCSVGCRVVVQTSRNRLLRYQGVDLDPVNWGWLCDKGRFDFEAVNSEERLASPLLRDEGLLLEPATWSAALAKATSALRLGIDRGGAEGVAVLGGSRLTNEDAYAWTKLAKGIIGTDNVDCQLGDGLPAEAVLGLPRATINEACQPGGVVLLVGPDPKEELPVLYLRLRHAVLNDDVALVELAPTETATTHLATHSLRHRTGEVFALVEALISGEAPTEVAGVRADQIEDVARLLTERPLTVILGRANLAETAIPTAAAAKLIHQARPEVKFLSALRRANVHGALDMGMAPGLLPGRVGLGAARGDYSVKWPRVPDGVGLDATGILQAAADGRIETLFLLGADPLNDFPDRELAERALAGARTVIATDLFLTESARQADVVLPAAGYAEVAGTTTNLEGRVTTVAQAVTPPGTAQSDWVIAAELARRMGYDLGLESPRQAWQELAEVVPAFGQIGVDLIANTAGDDGVLVKISGLTEAAAPPTDAAAHQDDSDASVVGATVPPAQAAVQLPVWTIVEPHQADAYSFRLVANRKLYDQGTLVRHSSSLVGLSEGAVVRLNTYDFEKLGLKPGDEARLTSARGQVLVPVRPSDGVPRGVALLHFNQSGGRANALVDINGVVTDVRVERP